MNKVKSLLAGLTIFVLSAPFIARADVVGVNQMFGGNATNAADFANTAGLGSGDLTSAIAYAIRVGLGFLGVAAVAIILIGGFKWVTAGGEDEKVKKAKKYIFQGLFGLVIVLAAYTIATFALGAITEAMNSAS
jgi:hypothetical protein